MVALPTPASRAIDSMEICCSGVVSRSFSVASRMAMREASLRTRPGDRGRAGPGAADAPRAAVEAGVRARALAAADGEEVLVGKEFPVATATAPLSRTRRCPAQFHGNRLASHPAVQDPARLHPGHIGLHAALAR